MVVVGYCGWEVLVVETEVEVKAVVTWWLRAGVPNIRIIW